MGELGPQGDVRPGPFEYEPSEVRGAQRHLLAVFLNLRM